MTEPMSQPRPRAHKNNGQARWRAIVLGFSALPILMVSASLAGVYYFRNIATHPTAAVPTAAPVAEKTPSPGSGQDQYVLGSGSYTSQTELHSKADTGDRGQLYSIKNNDLGVAFMTAFSDTDNVNALPLAAGWTVQQIGHDGMWVPGACAQKPSWLIANRFIVIDDGSYGSSGPTHYYAAYDTQTQHFIEFGGSVTTDTKPNEKILLVNGEGDNLVFYIDLRDPGGPFANSANFKHSRSSRENYIVRRVISLPGLTYQDYKIPYSDPAFDVYYTKMTGYGATVRLELSTDGSGVVQTGSVTPNQEVALASGDASHLLQIGKNMLGYDTLKPLHDGIAQLVVQQYPSFSSALFTEPSPSPHGSPVPTPNLTLITLTYHGQQGDSVYLGVSTGAPIPSVPGVYDQRSNTLNLASPADGASAWQKVSGFTLGVFQS